MSLHAHLQVALGTLSLDVELAAPAGSVLAVLGPNGAGKTTILRTLAGFSPLTGGHVDVAGRRLDDPVAGVWVVPEERRVGFVHQDLLLFPHLSVLDNVAFGPRSAGAARAASRRLAHAWLERVGLAQHADDRPSVLSGGQAQRVALARALVAEPDLLLLDEPLSALDVGTRATTRRDLHHFLEGFAGVTVVVTHDPLDALTLAREVVVLEDGSVTQGGSIAEVTARPRTRYVADLLGTNLLRGEGAGHAVVVDGARVEVAEVVEGATFVTISPRAVALHTRRPEGSARNAWPATITDLDLIGERVRVHLAGPVPLVAEITTAALTALALHPGEPIWVTVKATEVATYPA
ncbi:MAG: transporter ATP-binding protein [Acidimicrobiales bacterium]|nr:transporter ATP-binding protein [Acidimicrobiales bacterium]